MKKPVAPAPPSSDRGAQITAPVENQVVLDWLEFTVSLDIALDALPTFIGFADYPVTEAPKGLLGYRRQLLVAGARILTGGSVEMGHHVIISAQAMANMKKSVNEVCAWVSKFGQFTRIDIAFDDVEKRLDLDNIRASVKGGSCISRFKKYRRIEGGTLKDGSVEGETIYFGSTQSRIMVRIYDKAAETGLKAIDKFCHWLRVELQCRESHANEIGKLLAHGDRVSYFAASLLNNYISFRRSSSDSNKTRWVLTSWWSSFIDTASKMSIAIPKVKKTLLEKKEWFQRSMSKTLAMLGHAFGADELERIFSEGVLRMRAPDWEMVTLARI